MPGDQAILENSTDPTTLAFTLSEFAASDQSADQATVLRHLGSPSFLLRVNTAPEYVSKPAKTLRIARVVKTLMDSPHAVSKPTIVALIQEPDFLSFDALQELLIIALGVVGPSPPGAIRFWDSHSQPDSAYLHLVIETIFVNRSAPALALFERKMADERIEIEIHTIWLRDQMLRQRNDLEVLNCCQHMVMQGSVPEHVRQYVVQALCDYRREWYLDCTKPRPPLRALASAESKEVLRQICRFAEEHLSLEPSIRAAVELTMVEIGARRSQPPPSGGA